MTPKEKAKELIEKYLPQIMGADRYNYNLEDMNLFIAKQCALIAVDEILSLNTESFDELPNPHHRFSKNYWQQVKQEIEKL